MRLSKSIGLTLFLLLLGVSGADAQVTITSANGHPWDIITTDGNVNDGGGDAFDGFGFLGLRVLDASSISLGEVSRISGFNLVQSEGNARLIFSTAPVSFNGVTVTRQLYMPPGTDFLRYFDTFVNTTTAPLKIQVAFQGNLGSDSSTVVSATASGDQLLTAADVWAVTTQGNFGNPGIAPVGDPVVGMLAGNIHLTAVARGAFSGASPFDSTFTSSGDDNLSFVYSLDVAPGESVSTVFFVFRGLSEVANQPNGSPPPPAGSQVPAAVAALTAMLANPDFSQLSAQQIAQISNLTAVPEPSTWALLVSGGVMLLLGARRWVRG